VIQALLLVTNKSLGVKRLACVEGINTPLSRPQEMPTGSNCYYKNAMTTIFIPHVTNLRGSYLTLNSIHKNELLVKE